MSKEPVLFHKLLQEEFNKTYSHYFRVVWTIVVMALAIGLFGDYLYGTAQVGALPITIIWIVIVPVWLTHLVRKADELDAIFEDWRD